MAALFDPITIIIDTLLDLLYFIIKEYFYSPEFSSFFC